MKRAIFSMIIALGVGLGGVAHANPLLGNVQQGDRLIITTNDLEFQCTAGYVDAANARIWVAGHCGDHGSDVYDTAGNHIGTLHHIFQRTTQLQNLPDTQRHRQEPNYVLYDIAYVQANPTTVLRKNIYSGDRPYSPHLGEDVCRYGATTNAIHCAPVIYINQHILFAQLDSQSGDSGGPIWSPGKGYVGQLIATEIFNDGVRREAYDIVHREDFSLLRKIEEGHDRRPHKSELHESRPPIKKTLAEAFGADSPTAAELTRIKEILAAEARPTAPLTADEYRQRYKELLATQDAIRELDDAHTKTKIQNIVGAVIGVVIATLGFVLQWFLNTGIQIPRLRQLAAGVVLGAPY